MDPRKLYEWGSVKGRPRHLWPHGSSQEQVGALCGKATSGVGIGDGYRTDWTANNRPACHHCDKIKFTVAVVPHSETRMRRGECRTVNKGDRVRVRGGRGTKITVDSVAGYLVDCYYEFRHCEYGECSEYVTYRVWDLEWSSKAGAWMLPDGHMGLSPGDLR